MFTEKKALRAYPTPEIAVSDPIDPAAADAAIEAARHARETALRQQRLHSVRDNRNEQVRLFSKSMSGWLRGKLMKRPAIEPVQDLCTYVRQQKTIRDMCRNEDYPEGGFNGVSEAV